MQVSKSEDNPIDQAKCIAIVTQYMAKQGWKLQNPAELVEGIWEDVARQNLSGQVAVERVQSQVWQCYAAILHEHCCQSESHLYNKAWEELRSWLSLQARFLASGPIEPDAVIQEAVTDLHQALQRSPLKSPRAFLAYALNSLRRKNIDLYRRRTAVKRGGDDEIYLTEMKPNSPNDENSPWDEITEIQGSETRSMETSLATEEIKEQIRVFFRNHLSTSLQRQVAEAHFLDGFSPSEIAQLMGKRPHEIRMAKARVVEKLRNLPPVVRQSLLDIIGAIDREVGNE